MTWSPLSLSAPASSTPTLSESLTVFTVSPWTHGVKEGNGNHTWLSFPNAVDAVTARVDISKAVFAIAITAASMMDFAQQAAALNAAFPFKEFAKWQRHAQALITLESDKFDLVDAVESQQAIAINAVPSISEQSKYAISNAALNEANALTGSDPLASLTAFESRKPSFPAAPILSGGNGWRFYAEADTKNALRINQRDHAYTITAMVVFMGSPAELSYLRELMP
ncbi:hypothetical protein A8139_05485 [Marinomonas primoryensis]|uniref:Uncharacterized protein n=1 Tax=Marinomonas primoryensis TaxID=178399 RepID=A0A2Z4PPV8_9GAMM|nr:hypothetical protein [Marinomonas primoryensis]AWX99502.1 hypothetical protein A8139_05485 [Marinomonas primoryensis]